MLGSRRSRDIVTCIACGDSMDRTNAREYDKYGDRWNRRGKEFEYLCKPCHRNLTHQPRSDLEDVLDAAGAGEHDQPRFLEQYHELIERRDSAE